MSRLLSSITALLTESQLTCSIPDTGFSDDGMISSFLKKPQVLFRLPFSKTARRPEGVKQYEVPTLVGDEHMNS